jgi:glycosyltransferase involved in cell wall biosynthesis
MDNNETIDISIVIPVRNEEGYLPACLDAIFCQTTKKHIEVIVVDNGSTDGSQEIAHKKGVKVIVELQKGVGPARRTGTAAARGAYILQIDADTRLPKDYIEQAFFRFSQDKELACLGGQMYWYDASRFANGVRRVLYVLFTPIVRLISRGALGPMGNNMMFSRDIYEKCAGFDPGLKFGEDADLTRQLHRYGKVCLDLTLLCNTSSRRFHLDRDFFIYCLNVFRICLGFKPLRNDLPSFSNSTIDK